MSSIGDVSKTRFNPYEILRNGGYSDVAQEIADFGSGDDQAAFGQDVADKRSSTDRCIALRSLSSGQPPVELTRLNSMIQVNSMIQDNITDQNDCPERMKTAQRAAYIKEASEEYRDLMQELELTSDGNLKFRGCYHRTLLESVLRDPSLYEEAFSLIALWKKITENKEFENFPRLKRGVLRVSKLPISRQPLSGLGNIPIEACDRLAEKFFSRHPEVANRIQSLDLSSAHLYTIKAEWLRHFPNLVEIDLRNNPHLSRLPSGIFAHSSAGGAAGFDANIQRVYLHSLGSLKDLKDLVKLRQKGEIALEDVAELEKIIKKSIRTSAVTTIGALGALGAAGVAAGVIGVTGAVSSLIFSAVISKQQFDKELSVKSLLELPCEESIESLRNKSFIMQSKDKLMSAEDVAPLIIAGALGTLRADARGLTAGLLSGAYDLYGQKDNREMREVLKDTRALKIAAETGLCVALGLALPAAVNPLVGAAAALTINWKKDIISKQIGDVAGSSVNALSASKKLEGASESLLVGACIEIVKTISKVIGGGRVAAGVGVATGVLGAVKIATKEAKLVNDLLAEKTARRLT